MYAAARRPARGVFSHVFLRSGPATLSVMREFLNDWWRLIKLTVVTLAIPVVLWLLLVWVGVLR